MTLRTFKHALTGRSMQVREGSRAERLVEADDNWTEDKPRKPEKKEAENGSGDSGGRGGVARQDSQRKRGAARRKSAGEG